ncbi:putative Cupin type-2 domain-containing protein [Seiridium cardinale]|uniref:Cupin type-2 domain-containing protein n=1 Tax=Seiridium cardinale TaxID=138064 RepID=A0ABR2XKF2_9PEZI
MAVEHFILPPTPYVPNNKHPAIVYRDVLPKSYSEESTTAFLEANKWEKKVKVAHNHFHFGDQKQEPSETNANIPPNIQGFWPGTPTHHFHPNTHECYGVVSGTTTMLLGRGQLDPPASDQGAEYGRLVPLAPGDVVVIPAGTSHMNVEMTEDYRFVGVYPLVSDSAILLPLYNAPVFGSVYYFVAFLISRILRRKNRGRRDGGVSAATISTSCPQLTDEISGVPIPAVDPVQGEGGILINLWSSTTASN